MGGPRSFFLIRKEPRNTICPSLTYLAAPEKKGRNGESEMKTSIIIFAGLLVGLAFLATPVSPLTSLDLTGHFEGKHASPLGVCPSFTGVFPVLAHLAGVIEPNGGLPVVPIRIDRIRPLKWSDKDKLEHKIHYPKSGAGISSRAKTIVIVLIAAAILFWIFSKI